MKLDENKLIDYKALQELLETFNHEVPKDYCSQEYFDKILDAYVITDRWHPKEPEQVINEALIKDANDLLVKADQVFLQIGNKHFPNDLTVYVTLGTKDDLATVNCPSLGSKQVAKIKEFHDLFQPLDEDQVIDYNNLEKYCLKAYLENVSEVNEDDFSQVPLPTRVASKIHDLLSETKNEMIDNLSVHGIYFDNEKDLYFDLGRHDDLDFEFNDYKANVEFGYALEPGGRLEKNLFEDFGFDVTNDGDASLDDLKHGNFGLHDPDLVDLRNGCEKLTESDFKSEYPDLDYEDEKREVAYAYARGAEDQIDYCKNDALNYFNDQFSSIVEDLNEQEIEQVRNYTSKKWFVPCEKKFSEIARDYLGNTQEQQEVKNQGRGR